MPINDHFNREKRLSNLEHEETGVVHAQVRLLREKRRDPRVLICKSFANGWYESFYKPTNKAVTCGICKRMLRARNMNLTIR